MYIIILFVFILLYYIVTRTSPSIYIYVLFILTFIMRSIRKKKGGGVNIYDILSYFKSAFSL